MEIKQFQVGADTKKYLVCLQKILETELKEKYGIEDFEASVEYGYILGLAVSSAGELSEVDFEQLLETKVEIPSRYELDEKKIQGNTVKLYLEKEVSDKIDLATLIISKQLGGVRVYRAMAVKLLLKYLLLQKLDDK